MNALPSEQADPWAVQFVDLESLHKPVTDAIVKEILDLRAQAQRGAPPPTAPARLLLGTAGVGKTHLFARLRRLVQRQQHQVTLIHLRPLIGGPQTPRLLLGQLFEALRHRIGERSQLDLLVGAVLALVAGENPNFPNAYLVELESLDAPDRAQRLEAGLDALLERNPALQGSFSYLEALLRVPFLTTARARFAWLSWLEGGEVDLLQSARFQVPGPLDENQVMAALRALAAVAAPASPLLLVFDQLENLVANDGHEGRIKAYAQLLMELVDSVPGLAIVQMAVESDWLKSIIPHIDSAPQSRLSVQSARRRHLLSLPTPEQSRELIGLWRAQLEPPISPLPWPFSEAGLEALCHQPGLTPRMLLQAFQEALVSGEEEAPPVGSGAGELPPLPIDPSLQATWEQHCAQARVLIQEAHAEERGVSSDILLDALSALGVVDPTLGVRRAERGEAEVQAPSVGRSVALVHSPNGKSVAAQLRKLHERIEGGGRLLAVRERWRPIPDGWKAAAEHHKALEAALSWRWLERDEVERYLALRSLLMSARSHDVSGPDGKALDEAIVLGWLRQQDSLRDDPLLLWWQERSAPVMAPTATSAVPSAASTATAVPPIAVPLPRSSTMVDHADSPLLGVLQRLRVASVPRLARELSTPEKPWRPAEVLRELKNLDRYARVLGASLVVIRDDQEGA
jgi:hypothetical protein